MPPDPSLAIEKIVKVSDNILALCRTNGEIQLMCLQTGKITKTYKIFDNSLPFNQKTSKNRHFIALESVDGLLIAATAFGLVTYIHADPTQNVHVKPFNFLGH
jgi:hypothetical protein